MGSSSPAARWDPREDGWLSGFTAGEGTFGFNSARGGVWAPRFTIGLHPCDAAVLRECAAALGGTVRVYADGGSPKAIWTVSAKAHLLDLVAYFDRFPLRAVKRDDYALWRESVLIYARSARPREHAAELEALKSVTREGRVTRLRRVA